MIGRVHYCIVCSISSGHVVYCVEIRLLYMSLLQGGTSGDGSGMYALVYEANFLKANDNTNVGGKLSQAIVRTGREKCIWRLA